MTDEVKKDEPTKTLLWMPYGDIAKILLGLLVGIGATIFTTYWTAKEAKLFYSVSPPVNLDNISIVSISVTNEGNKEAEDVLFSFVVDGKTITDAKVSPDVFRAVKDTSKKDALTVELKLLNVGETAQLVITTNNPTPKIDYKANLRGKGVVGKEGSNLEKRLEEERATNRYKLWAMYVIMVLTLLSGFLGYLVRKQTREHIDILQKANAKYKEERDIFEAYLKREEERYGVNRTPSVTANASK